jgi:gliding motility-associated-like protein
MEWKDYREQPDEGLFENIARRVRRRRWMRRGGAVAGVVAVAAVLCVVLWPSGEKDEPVIGAQVARLQSSPSATPSASEAEAVTVTVPTATEGTPVVEPAKQSAPPAKEETNMRKNKSEAERDMAALVPSYTHVATHLTLPSEPQQEIKWNCVNDGVAIVEKEPLEEKSEPSASTDLKTAVKSSEQPLHEDDLFWAPNIIVPAGDVDDNRTFGMKFSSAVTHFQVYIYNRAGRQVFHSNDPSFVWDGTYKGTMLPQSAYVWVVKFRDSSGKLHEERGTVTLIR